MGGIKEDSLTLGGRGGSRGEWKTEGKIAGSGRRKRRLRGVGDGRED